MSYTYQQIEDLWVQYGGNPAAAAMAASIAMAESGGNPGATNTANSDGSVDRGLFQINSVHGSESTYDLASNVKAAIAISSNGSNWGPWSTYNNGAYQRYYNPSVQPTGQSVSAQTDNSGISLAASNVANYVPAVPAVTPVLSLDMLRSEYPMVAAVVTSVPELQSIFNQAVSGSWSTDKFIAAVQNSNWWKTTSDTARQAFATMKADPATWNQNVTNLEATLQQTAASLGANLSSGQLMNLAVDAITNGYDQNSAVIQEKMSQYVTPVSGNHFGGQAGTDETQIRQAMMDLGVSIPESNLDSQLKQIIAGSQTVEGVNAQLRTQAAATYPAYASEINSGMNVSDIASPYISRAQQLLEQGPGQLNIYSPLIKSALQYTQNGTPTAMPMGDFEMQVRRDPSWVSTDNAQDSFMSTAHQVLQNFGFEF